jgi:hypothetical protein
MNDFKVVATYETGGELSGYTLTKQQNTKTLKDIWVVKMTKRLSSSEFQELRNKVKAKGGYYSSFPTVRGFVFDKEPNRETVEELFGNEIPKQQHTKEQSDSLEDNNNRIFVVNKDGSKGAYHDRLSREEAKQLWHKYYGAENVEILTWDKEVFNEYGKVVKHIDISMEVFKDEPKPVFYFNEGDRVAMVADSGTKGTVKSTVIIKGALRGVRIDWDFGTSDLIGADDFEGIVKINDNKPQKPTENEIIGFTSAPESYDGFGTKTISDSGYLDDKGKKTREISIPEKNYDWQTLRYKSGNYGFYTKEEFDKYKGSIFVKPTENQLNVNPALNKLAEKLIELNLSLRDMAQLNEAARSLDDETFNELQSYKESLDGQDIYEKNNILFRKLKDLVESKAENKQFPQKSQSENKLSGVIFSTEEKGNHSAIIKDVKYKTGITDLKIKYGTYDVSVIYGKKQSFDRISIRKDGEDYCIGGASGGYCDIKIEANKLLSIFRELYNRYLTDKKFSAVKSFGELIMNVEDGLEISEFKSQFPHRYLVKNKSCWKLVDSLVKNGIKENLHFYQTFEESQKVLYFKDISSIELSEKIEQQIFNLEKQEEEKLISEYPDIFISEDMPEILKALAKGYNDTKPTERKSYTNRAYFGLAGDYNQDRRIAIIQALTGEKVPAYKAGIGAMQEHLDKWLNKMIESAKFVKTDDKQEVAQTKQTETLDELHPLDMWKRFGDRFYRKFEFSKSDMNIFRDISDLGIKERLTERADGGYDVIISVRSQVEADNISELYMKLKPINDVSNLTENPKEENPITIYDKFDSGLLNDWRTVGGSPISVLKELDRLKKVGQAIYRSGVATYSAIISGLSDRDLKIIEAIKKEYNWNEEVAKTEQKPAVEEKQVYKHGFDKVYFEAPSNWLAILSKSGVKQKPVGIWQGGNYSAYLWEGDGIKIVTAYNPLEDEEDALAGYIGIEGEKQKVLSVAKQIKPFSDGESKGQLDFIGFNYEFQPIGIPQAEESPMVKKYNSLKAKYPEAVLWFRIGDFYETYKEDAIKTANELGTILTKDEGGVPKTGFPAHSLDNYLPKMVKSGIKVAVADELESPKAKEEVAENPIDEVITTVRDLANKEAELQEGLLSGAFFSSLEKGDTFTVGKKKYTVDSISKPKPQEYTNKKGEIVKYSKNSIRIKSEKGEVVSGEFWQYANGNSAWLGNGQTKKQDKWGQLSRDIDGDITVDLINENNSFHEKSDSYKKVQEYIGKSNQTSEKDQIRVLANGIYQKKIDNGEMTAEQVIEILNNAGVEVPQSIKDRIKPTESKNEKAELLELIEGYELLLEDAQESEKEELQELIDGYKLLLEDDMFAAGGQVQIDNEKATLEVFNRIASKVTIQPKYEKLVKGVILQAVKGIIDRNKPFKEWGLQEGDEKAFKNLKKYITPDFNYDEASVTPLTESIIREVLNIPAPVMPKEHYDFEYYCKNELKLDRDELDDIEIYTPLSQIISRNCGDICQFSKIIYNGELDTSKLPFDLVEKITDWIGEFEYDIENNSNSGNFQSEELKYDLSITQPKDYYILINKYGIDNMIERETKENGKEIYSEIMDCCQSAIFTEEERAAIIPIDFNEEITTGKEEKISKGDFELNVFQNTGFWGGEVYHKGRFIKFIPLNYRLKSEVIDRFNSYIKEVKIQELGGKTFISDKEGERIIDKQQNSESVLLTELIEGYELLIEEAKGKEKQELQELIDGYKLLLEDDMFAKGGQVKKRTREQDIDLAYSLMVSKADAMELKYGERTNTETIHEGITEFKYQVMFCDKKNKITTKIISVSIKGF